MRPIESSLRLKLDVNPYQQPDQSPQKLERSDQGKVQTFLSLDRSPFNHQLRYHNGSPYALAQNDVWRNSAMDGPKKANAWLTQKKAKDPRVHLFKHLKFHKTKHEWNYAMHPRHSYQ